MLFFRRKRGQLYDAEKEREIQNIRKDMFKKIDQVTESAEKVRREFEEGGVTEMIFLATGGDQRRRGRKR